MKPVKKEKVRIPEPKKIYEFSENFSLWKVHHDSLRERDKNARVMTQDKMNQLAENIKSEGGLFESLPLVTPIKNKGGNSEFLIISGHHRIRASRSVGISELHVIVANKVLSKDEIISKQLSHNALSGYDDLNVLKELYEEIGLVDLKIASGLTDKELDIPMMNVNIDDIKIDLDFELVSILFLSKQTKKFEKILSYLEDEAKIYIADKSDFDKTTVMIRAVSKEYNVINIAGIFKKMMEIVEDHLKEVKKKEIVVRRKDKEKDKKIK